MPDFTYDDSGNRTKKQTSNGTVTYYLNSGNTVLNEIGSTGTTTKSMVYGLSPIAEIDTNNIITYTHQDTLGSTVLTTDQSGNVVTKYEYDPFGQLIGQDGISNTNYLYTGQEYDQESDLYYYNARYYNPRLGRFISRDPYLGHDGDSLTRNGYTYVKNNPLKYVDPSGETEKQTVYDQPETYLGRTLSQWNSSFISGQENINFVGDLLTFGMFSNAFERADQAGQRMHDEGVNFSTVGNTFYQVGMGTIGAGGGALMTGMAAGELKLMATPFLAGKAIEQESEAVTVYRVEAPIQKFKTVQPNGNIDLNIKSDTVHLNFGEEQRAVDFLNKRFNQGYLDSQAKSFKVEKNYLDYLNDMAKDDFGTSKIKSGVFKVDTQYPNQFQLKGKEQIDILRDNILPGTAKNLTDYFKSILNL